MMGCQASVLIAPEADAVKNKNNLDIQTIAEIIL